MPRRGTRKRSRKTTTAKPPQNPTDQPPVVTPQRDLIRPEAIKKRLEERIPLPIYSRLDDKGWQVVSEIATTVAKEAFQEEKVKAARIQNDRENYLALRDRELREKAMPIVALILITFMGFIVTCYQMGFNALILGISFVIGLVTIPKIFLLNKDTKIRDLRSLIPSIKFGDGKGEEEDEENKGPGK